MTALVWLAIPVGALLLATLWVAWASRPRRPAGMHETLAEHQRFKAVFEPSHGDGRPAKRRP
jgi:hypothetical protein